MVKITLNYKNLDLKATFSKVAAIILNLILKICNDLPFFDKRINICIPIFFNYTVNRWKKQQRYAFL